MSECSSTPTASTWASFSVLQAAHAGAGSPRIGRNELMLIESLHALSPVPRLICSAEVWYRAHAAESENTYRVRSL